MYTNCITIDFNGNINSFEKLKKLLLLIFSVVLQVLAAFEKVEMDLGQIYIFFFGQLTTNLHKLISLPVVQLPNNGLISSGLSRSSGSPLGTNLFCANYVPKILFKRLNYAQLLGLSPIAFN